MQYVTWLTHTCHDLFIRDKTHSYVKYDTYEHTSSSDAKSWSSKWPCATPSCAFTSSPELKSHDMSHMSVVSVVSLCMRCHGVHGFGAWIDAPRPDDSIWMDPENPSKSRQWSVVSVILYIWNWVCRASWRDFVVPLWMWCDSVDRCGAWINALRPDESIWTDPENPSKSRQGGVVFVILCIYNLVCSAFVRDFVLSLWV